jgi:hypothetical protein
MQQPSWYAQWRHDALHELIEKNDRLKETYGLSGHERYDYDIDKQELVFSNDGKPFVVARIQIVGSTAISAGNWLWAWANSWWPKDSIEAAEATRDFGEQKNIEELTSEYLYGDALENLGWEMTAVTARVSGAIGAYRPPTENGHLFFVYTEISFASKI